jgi:hypothetical protein
MNEYTDINIKSRLHRKVKNIYSMYTPDAIKNSKTFHRDGLRHLSFVRENFKIKIETQK